MISGWETSANQTRIVLDEPEYSRKLIKELLPFVEDGLEEIDTKILKDQKQKS